MLSWRGLLTKLEYDIWISTCEEESRAICRLDDTLGIPPPCIVVHVLAVNDPVLILPGFSSGKMPQRL